MEVQLKIVGIVQILLAIIHLFFPRKFDWKNELHKLSLLNQQMMQVHTFFIALTVFLMGILNLSSAELLINTELGKRICLGMGIFWLFRLGIQFFGYSSLLWRGKRVETGIHILFIFTWIYFTYVNFNVFFKALELH